MNTMLRWSPTRQFHFHHGPDGLLDRFVASTTDEAARDARPWLPAAEGWIEDGTYVIQLALPGVDPKDVQVSWMDNVLTVKGERNAEHDITDETYFLREIVYGAFQRRFELPEGVDAAEVKAKHVNGMLQVMVPAPRAATPRLIEVTAN
jgi:HSP20 family protein